MGSAARKHKTRIFFPDDDVDPNDATTTPAPPTGVPKRTLTIGELRHSMMDTLTRQGVVGSLKAQLRAQMLGSLKETAVQGGLLRSTDKGPLEASAARRGQIPLRLRVVESLFEIGRAHV
jgi:hypothetical protein